MAAVMPCELGSRRVESYRVGARARSQLRFESERHADTHYTDDERRPRHRLAEFIEHRLIVAEITSWRMMSDADGYRRAAHRHRPHEMAGSSMRHGASSDDFTRPP